MTVRQKKTTQGTQRKSSAATKAKADETVQVEADVEAQSEDVPTVEDTTSDTEGDQGGTGGDVAPALPGTDGGGGADPLLSRFVTGEPATSDEQPTSDASEVGDGADEAAQVKADLAPEEAVEAEVLADVYGRPGASARKDEIITVTGAQLARGVRDRILRAV